MQGCSGDNICRAEYSCVLPANINQDGEWQADVPPDERIARVIDLDQTRAAGKICVALTGNTPPESDRNAQTEASLVFDGGVFDVP